MRKCISIFTAGEINSMPPGICYTSAEMRSSVPFPEEVGIREIEKRENRSRNLRLEGGGNWECSFQATVLIGIHI